MSSFGECDRSLPKENFPRSPSEQCGRLRDEVERLSWARALGNARELARQHTKTKRVHTIVPRGDGRQRSTFQRSVWDLEKND